MMYILYTVSRIQAKCMTMSNIITTVFFLDISRPQPSPPSHHSPNTSFLSRSILLPPPKQPTLTEKGRPYSATRRVRPRSIASLNPTDEYRLQFALKVC